MPSEMTLTRRSLSVAESRAASEEARAGAARACTALTASAASNPTYDRLKLTVSEYRDQQAPKRAPAGDGGGSSSTTAAMLHYQEGHRLFAAGDYAEAAAELLLAIQHGHPAKARCHNTRGVVLAALGSYDDAVAAFTCALDHDPGMHTALSNRGQAHWKRGDLRAAIADLRQASSHHSCEEIAQLLEDAEAELVTPASASSFQQAALQRFASRVEGAEAARIKFEAALQMEDSHATRRCFNCIGLCHFVQGANDPALAALSRATEVDPNNASACHNYAKALSESVSARLIARCACRACV
jgi:tetratricopeptide (TPR) repeat protein